MAAPVADMVAVSEDSSSSDDEALRRCQEAVWETRSHANKDADSCVQQSKRVVVAEHEHDGNELQVSQGFRTHVAKKLGTLLDSCITEIQTSSCVESANGGDDDGDEGFRLFSTSVPGQSADDPPAPVRRRPVPSSSDSDSEMETRLKEAAVSVKDLLPSMPSTLATPSKDEPPSSDTIKAEKKAAEGDVVTKKKKKKRKQNQEASDVAGSPRDVQSNSEQEDVQIKVKRKKKKKREGNTEEDPLN